MSPRDPIRPDDRLLSNLPPLARDPLRPAHHTPDQDFRRRRSVFWWAVGALTLPFITMTGYIVYVVSVRGSGVCDVAPACLAGTALGASCLLRLPLPVMSRVWLVAVYVPVAGVAVVIYGLLFAGVAYDWWI